MRGVAPVPVFRCFPVSTGCKCAATCAANQPCRSYPGRRRIRVAAGAEPDGRVAITVADDGAGIDAADLPHLFDRLYRADRSRIRGTGGSGLGLAIARAIVTAHSGTITAARGGPGQGTTVRFSLPGAT